MARKTTLLCLLALAGFGAKAAPVIAVRAGQLFDPKSGALFPNQIVLIAGERITDVGPADRVQIPPGAQVIDLSRATVLPGLIDQHVHVMEAGLRNPPLPIHDMPVNQAGLDAYIDRVLLAVVDAQKDLNAGFTTINDMGSHGGSWGTVALRDAIDKGLLRGPRMLVAGPTLSEMNPKLDSAEAARAAVRELADHHVNWVKITSSGAFTFRADGTLDIKPGNPGTLEITRAIVEEAHKHGLKVACHAYGGEGLRNCIDAGADAPQHGLDLDDQSLRMLLQKNIPLNATLFDLRLFDKEEMEKYANSRFRMMEKSFKKALAAGVRLGFSSGAQADNTGFPHGSQGETFAYLVKWGLAPAQALRTATTVNAEIIGWQDRVGTVEKGKFADLIAVAGDPLKDITEMQRVKFVMKGGDVVRNDFK